MKNQKAPNLVTIGILTVITVFFWIIFSVFRLLSTPTKVDVSAEVLAPLTPTLDSQILEGINEKLFFSDSEIGETQITEIVQEEAGEEESEGGDEGEEVSE